MKYHGMDVITVPDGAVVTIYGQVVHPDHAQGVVAGHKVSGDAIVVGTREVWMTTRTWEKIRCSISV